MRKTIKDRLERSIILNPYTGCWDTLLAKNDKGYSQIWYENHTKGAHRVSYQVYVGGIPLGKVLDHICRNRSCINPHHLRPVTHRENVLLGIGFGGENARKTHCMRGHEFTPENTIIGKKGLNKTRNCKTCRRQKATSLSH